MDRGGGCGILDRACLTGVASPPPEAGGRNDAWGKFEAKEASPKFIDIELVEARAAGAYCKIKGLGSALAATIVGRARGIRTGDVATCQAVSKIFAWSRVHQLSAIRRGFYILMGLG
jgi:hypothetical protein